MPCLFIRNIPKGTIFEPSQTRQLFELVTRHSGSNIEDVEIHLENTDYIMLRPDGSYDSDHGVHVFVEWHGGRSLDSKAKIAWVIHVFLNEHGLGSGSDITFRDSPRETFFIEGELVPGAR